MMGRYQIRVCCRAYCVLVLGQLMKGTDVFVVDTHETLIIPSCNPEDGIGKSNCCPELR